MKSEQSPEEAANSENKYDSVTKFRELFLLLRSEKAGKEYLDAYEEAAGMAKEFVETKDRSSWNATEFQDRMRAKYLNVSDSFIDALIRCIEAHTPPINLPSRPLWE